MRGLLVRAGRVLIGSTVGVLAKPRSRLPKIFPSAIACLATLSWLARVADMPSASNPPGGTYFSAGIDAASVQD